MPTELIESVERLEAIAGDWEDLWRRASNATPFQSPHWLLPWWRAFGCDRLFAVAVWGEGRLEAIAPLYILVDEETGESLGMFLGTGISDYLDVLGGPESVPGILDSMAKSGCPVWDLQQIPPASPLLAAELPPDWSVSVVEQDRCPVLPIVGETSGLEGLLSPGSRKRLRYQRRLAHRQGRVEFESVTEETLEPLLESLFALHAARWRLRGLPGVLADRTTQDFHRAAARRLLRAGALRVHRMSIDGTPAAIYYGFVHRKTHYYYLGGYEPAFENLSVGTLVVARAIEDAIAEGAAAIDFLRGAEAYKYAWGAEDRVNRRLVLERS